MTGNIPPSFTNSGRKEVLERLRDDKLREGDIVMIKEMGGEILKAEMWNTLSKEEICQEYLDEIKEDLLKSVKHSTGQKQGSYATSDVVDEFASEIVKNIMSALVGEVEKTPALGDKYFIAECAELTFDRVVEQVADVITQLHEKSSTNTIDLHEKSAMNAIGKAISGLDVPIQNLVRSHFKSVGII